MNKIYNQWKHCIPDNQPFRMSAKVWSGKNKTLKYKYVTFTKPEQFRAWLKNNQAHLYEIVAVGI